jgi:hypothetical protein
MNPLAKALKHHPDAPTEDEVFHYGKQKDWARKLRTFSSQRSPIAAAAASEGARRLSVTPTQPPIGASMGKSSATATSQQQQSISGVDAASQATSIPSLRVQPMLSSQYPSTGQDDERPASLRNRLCDKAFVQYTIGEYGFTHSQMRQLLEYIRDVGHRDPSTMSCTEFIMACDVINPRGRARRAAEEDENEDEDVGDESNEVGERQKGKGKEVDEQQEQEEQELEQQERPAEEEEQEEEEEEEQEEEQRQEQAEQEQEEQEQEEQEQEEQPTFNDHDFPKTRRFQDDEDDDVGAFQGRLLVRDMGAQSRTHLREGMPRPETAKDVFSAAPTSEPSKLSKTLYQMGMVTTTPSESEISGSNYSDDNRDDQYEKNVDDIISDAESATGKEKSKGRKPCRELKEVARHEGDRHEKKLRALAAQFNTSVNQVRQLALVSSKVSRDASNAWNDFQTWRKLVDPPRDNETSMFIFPSVMF